jgi:hypothetical protein
MKTLKEEFNDKMREHLETQILMGLNTYMKRLKNIFDGNDNYDRVPETLGKIAKICELTSFEVQMYAITEPVKNTKNQKLNFKGHYEQERNSNLGMLRMR